MANWDDITSIGNIEDRRGISPAAILGGGGGVVAILLALGLNFLGLNVAPSTIEDMLNSFSATQNLQVDQSQQPAEFRGEDSYEVFASKVLGSSNDVWTQVFSANGLTYSPPRLVLFRGVTQSGCGLAASQVGPHYCPNDSTIYLDETFFDELHTRFGASKGEVAQAYVIAHEVGHHVQNELGALASSAAQTQEGSIALELQADCYAGVWAYAQAKNGVFEGDEVSQAISAAAAVGDDRIQQATEGRVTPENWTHGSSEQRVGAFNTGYATGDPTRCVGF